MSSGKMTEKILGPHDAREQNQWVSTGASMIALTQESYMDDWLQRKERASERRWGLT